MSLPDSTITDVVHQLINRKLEDYEDDDPSNDVPSVMMRFDGPNPNFPPPISSINPSIGVFLAPQFHFQPRASAPTSTSTSTSTSASASTSTQDAASNSPFPDRKHDRIQFFVRMMSNSNTLVLNGKSDDTIEFIHQKIHTVTGIPVAEQRLIYCGRQLESEQTLAECNIKNDAGLHLVGRMRSTKHPKAWHLIDELISTIYKLCKGVLGVDLDSVKSSLIDFLDMMEKNEIKEDHPHPVPHMNIFQSLCAPSALVMLYVSPHLGNKECAEESIRHFMYSCKTILPKSVYSKCAPVMLDFCNLLGKAVPTDDPLYILCRSSLGSSVENLKIRKSSRNSSNIAVEDIFPFVFELSSKISECLLSSMEFISNSSSLPSDVRDFAAFLRPLKAAFSDLPDFGGVIPVPIRHAPFYLGEIKTLFAIFGYLLEKIQTSLDKMESELSKEPKRDAGWDQYLLILKELHGIAKIYQGQEERFWVSVKRYKVSLCYLLVRYAKRGEDYEWILGHKEVLDFEARRHLVMMLLPEMKDEYEEVHEMLIDRSQLLAESFEYIAHADPETLRSGLFMEFKNEEATGPGVLREWFFLVCREIFNPQNALFDACPNDRRRFFPNPASKVDPLHLEYFNFAGRVIALALIHKVQVGIVFDRVFFLQLGGIDITLDDIKDADPDLHKSCKQILEMDPDEVDQDALGLTFVHEVEELGSMKAVELYDNGRNVIVNSGNREEYVDLLIQHRFVTRVKEQVSHFAQGFVDIVGEEKIRKLFFKSLEVEDLDGMLHGSESVISVEDWKLHTEYNGFKGDDPLIEWFWKIVEEMTSKQRNVLLFFWTSLKHLPVEGFRGLPSKLHIYKSIESIEFLPSSHTCFYRICFPAYPSIDVMRERLNIITQDHVGCSFGTW